MHTEGPWSVSGVRSKLDGQPHLFVTRPDGRSVAAIPYSDRTNQDHIASHADARLIAAAPELLEALRSLLADCIEYAAINNLHNSDGAPATHHAMRQAHAAIIKATEPRP